MDVYKYCSLASALKIVKSGAVVLNAPSRFNDPFDSRFFISNESRQKTIDLIHNYSVFIGLADFVDHTIPKSSKVERSFFVLSRTKIEKTKDLIRKTGCYEAVPFFDVALEKMSSIYPELDRSIKEMAKVLEEKIFPSIAEFREKARISCFSKRNDSMLMWSHYADSHRGVCIQFEENRHFFKDVVYSDERCDLDLLSAVSRVLAFGFMNTPIDMRDSKFADAILRPFFHKSKDWSYEEEVRCVLSNNEPKTGGYVFDGKNTLLSMNIKRVLIGCRASFDDTLNDLLLAAENRGIPVVFMKEDEKLLRIVPDPERSMKPKEREIRVRNAIETIRDEVDVCLDSGCFYAALSLTLTVPFIMGKATYPELSEKESYIKWFQENIGRFETDGTPGMPYINGEVCWAMQESIRNRGAVDIKGSFGDVSLSELKLKVEAKNPLNLYCSAASSGKNPKLEISIRDFCWKMTCISSKNLEKKPELAERIPPFSLFRFDIEIDNLKEHLVRNETFRKQLLG